MPLTAIPLKATEAASVQRLVKRVQTSHIHVEADACTRATRRVTKRRREASERGRRERLEVGYRAGRACRYSFVGCQSKIQQHDRPRPDT
mmetsp:Transcript_15404/g.22943  ORF Transcript_15404/g.22943 Transcript_15404/m.22943 type:complete len:90 (-) Transcript_15404:51-320(-)